MTSTQPSEAVLCTVAILAGGMGTRLRERTGESLPKPMVPVLGRPLLEHQIALCRDQGFNHIALLVHYQHQSISNHFGDGSSFGVRLRYAVEDTPRGTAGALRDALPLLAPKFLVLYGDTYLDVDLLSLWNAHATSGAIGTLFLHPNDHPQDSDLVEIDHSGRILAIHPYPHPEGRAFRNLVNAGLYAMTKAGLESVLPSKKKEDLAKHTFPSMLQAGLPLASYVSPEYIKDLGTPDRLDSVVAGITSGLAEKLSRRGLRKAVFLDRDGTLNNEVNHLNHPDQLVLFADVPSAIQRINQSGLLAVAITNQPVIARGDLTWEGLGSIHARLDLLLGVGHAYLDAVYVCPHHPHRGFDNEVAELKVDCNCRKPRTGMIDKACEELSISRQDSWFVGDSTSDMEAGRRAGLLSMLVRTGYGGRDGKFLTIPDYTSPNLLAAIRWILDGHPKLRTRILPIVAEFLGARLILIGGLSRSGKSSVAQVFKETYATVSRRAHILSLDSWLLPSECREEGAGVLTRYDITSAVIQIEQLLDKSQRHQLRLPKYDPLTRTVSIDSPIQFIDPDDVIIVEGVPALATPRLTSSADARIFVETTEQERIRRIREDYQWRGLTSDQIDDLLAARGRDESSVVIDSSSHSNISLFL